MQRRAGSPILRVGVARGEHRMRRVKFSPVCPAD
jgi:hypothetical protein